MDKRYEFLPPCLTAQFWTPEMESGFDRTGSLFCITSSEQSGNVPQLIVASAFVDVGENHYQAYLLTRETFPLFWEQNPNLNWRIYDAGKTLAALAGTFDDPAKVYNRVHERKITDVHLMGRLLSLALNGDPTAFKSLAQCADFVKTRQSVISAIKSFCSSPPDFAEWIDVPKRIPHSLLHQVFQVSKLILLLHNYAEEAICSFIDTLDPSASFGFPRSPTWLQQQEEAFGKLTHDIQIWADIVYESISRRGLHVDTKRAQELSAQYKTELNRLVRQMKEYGYEPKTACDDQAARLLLGDFGKKQKIPFVTKENKISLAKRDLLPYVQHFDFIPLFLRAKELARWLASLAKMDKPRLYPQYSILATTGRCYASGDLAIQSLTRQGGLRECIIPSPGHVFLIVDFVMLELVMFAQALIMQLGYKSKLADLINEGSDVHRKIAAMMFQKNEEDVTDQQRKCAKVLNFGIPGGLGVKRLMEKASTEFQLHWTEAEAKQMKKKWLGLLSEVRDFLSNPAKPPQGVWTGTGRFRATSEFTELRNTIFQGLGADGMNLALKRLWGYGYQIAAVIHDEVLIEVPQSEDYTETVAEVERLMIEGMSEVAPDMKIRVESFISNCWGKQ